MKGGSMPDQWIPMPDPGASKKKDLRRDYTYCVYSTCFRSFFCFFYIENGFNLDIYIYMYIYIYKN